jgi:thioredoxin-like negative regulator of GroEL
LGFRCVGPALTLTPNNLDVIGLLANSYLQTGEQAKARALLDEAIEKTEHRQVSGSLMRELQRLKATLVAPPATPVGQALDTDASLVALLGQRKYEEALQVALSMRNR